MDEYLNNLESISKRVYNQKSTKVIFLWCDYINSIHKLLDSFSDAEKNKINSIRISYYKSDEGYFCRKKFAYIFMDGEHLPKVYDYEEKDVSLGDVIKFLSAINNFNRILNDYGLFI